MTTPDRTRGLGWIAPRACVGLLALGVLCAVVVPIYVAEPGPIAHAHVLNSFEDPSSCRWGPGLARPSLLARSTQVGWECSDDWYGCVTLERELLGWRVVDSIWQNGHSEHSNPFVIQAPDRGCA